MYQYSQADHQLLLERVTQFRDQVERRLKGDLSEEEFKNQRLRNGLYLQLHAYMLRVAVPYGLLSSEQMRTLAHIARRYDRGYGHFSTRQNIQYNWPKLEEVPEILDALAAVEMHAIQTSGNCIRNTTSDPLAGVARDEIADPRPYCELIRQWSTFHPEFNFLPRKFKIAVSGAIHDRAAVAVHDIGLRLVKNDAGELGLEVYVGGGLGRTPMIGKLVRDFLPVHDMLTYMEAILRVYNQLGRRDNLYKARIKILVHETGEEKFRELVEAEWENIKASKLRLRDEDIDAIRAHFKDPEYEDLADFDETFDQHLLTDTDFAKWVDNNLELHKKSGYRVVYLSLKSPDQPPGDVTADQMDSIADLADRYSLGQIRSTHRQNLVLSDVKLTDLYELWQELKNLGLATPNYNHLTDIIACPGMDYCSLATARSLPIAQALTDRFENYDYVNDLGDISLNISGCINACGHHHVANIGILGVNKKGIEVYQLTLGGSAREDAAIGKIIGPAFTADEIVGAVGTVLDVYLQNREDEEEDFLTTYRRIGQAPFKEQLYG
ncbi:nitrite/sulfite reductase [Sneathiella sp. P13V-1]|uniref:nitrite/sulfite reductase n=1 Tax=Sneathiella sp. P13V-1 TaxID=2697366 RepID=UPI00187BA033|nr:nitrite/sulfite reductase [Sneathiella sp. P13V-1]MBE7636540.1 nitrite/sulfite reductase [Sneathiella sp. P13V-1]